MMRLWICGALLLLASCAPKRQIERRELRIDTFRAVMAEQLNVCMDDVIILPPDTLSPVIVAKHAELQRRAAAEVVNTSGEQLSEKVVEEPAPATQKPSLWPLLIIVGAVALFLKK